MLTADLTEAIIISIGGTVSTAGVLKERNPELQTSTIEIAGIQVFKHSALAVTSKFGMFSKVHYTTHNTKSVRDDSLICVCIKVNDEKCIKLYPLRNP